MKNYNGLSIRSLDPSPDGRGNPFVSFFSDTKDWNEQREIASKNLDHSVEQHLNHIRFEYPWIGTFFLPIPQIERSECRKRRENDDFDIEIFDVLIGDSVFDDRAEIVFVVFAHFDEISEFRVGKMHPIVVKTG